MMGIDSWAVDWLWFCCFVFQIHIVYSLRSLKNNWVCRQPNTQEDAVESPLPYSCLTQLRAPSNQTWGHWAPVSTVSMQSTEQSDKSQETWTYQLSSQLKLFYNWIRYFLWVSIASLHPNLQLLIFRNWELVAVMGKSCHLLVSLCTWAYGSCICFLKTQA